MRAQCNDQYSKFTAEFTVIAELTDRLPFNRVSRMNFPEGIVLADPKFDMPGEIDFGTGIWAKILGPRIYRNSLGTLLQETEFGYVVLGRVKKQPTDTSCAMTMKVKEAQS